MTQRRVENTRVHFWSFSPVSVKVRANFERLLIQAKCILPGGKTLDAPQFLCNFLIKTKQREKLKHAIPPELANYTCPALLPPNDGKLICLDDFNAGSVLVKKFNYLKCKF